MIFIQILLVTNIVSLLFAVYYRQEHRESLEANASLVRELLRVKSETKHDRRGSV